MKHVLTIIAIVFIAFGFAAYGLKDSATSADTYEEIAGELDTIREDLKQTRDIDRCALLLENYSNALRQKKPLK